MDNFFNNFGTYYREAPLSTFTFWAFPVGTILFTWVLALLILNVFTKRKKLKTIFIINRAWIAASLIVGAIIIGLSCYWWVNNYFEKRPYELTLLFSLFIALLIPLISLTRLRNYYTPGDMKEIIDQPKTPSQLESSIIFLKKAFKKNKLFFLIPLLGFITLVFYFNKGTNLISIIVDNTPSQNNSFQEFQAALSQTVAKLGPNNHVIVTSFSDNTNTKKTFAEILKTTQYTPGVDNSILFPAKDDAINHISSLQLSNTGSPILEVIWQNLLFAQQSTSNEELKTKILLIITDGVENGVPLVANKFFCSIDQFGTYYPAENIFIIDYFNSDQNTAEAGLNRSFMQSALNCNYDVQKGGTTRDYYSSALDQILTGFSSNWNLVYWIIAIYSVMTFIGLLINSKKIA